MKAELLFNLGRATYALLFAAILVLLFLFNYAAVSFVFPLPLMHEFSASGRGFGAVLIGVPIVITDILLFRYIRSQLLKARWVAENKQRHEEELRRNQARRR